MKILKKLNQAKPDYLYEVEFMAWPNEPKNCYLFTCLCKRVKKKRITFTTQIVHRLGKVDPKDARTGTEFDIEDLDYIQVREIGPIEDYPEYLI